MRRYLKLADVQVYGTAADALISQGKPAYASSVWPGESAGFTGITPGNANDGNAANLFQSSCNLDGSGPWWVGYKLGGEP